MKLKLILALSVIAAPIFGKISDSEKNVREAILKCIESTKNKMDSLQSLTLTRVEDTDNINLEKILSENEMVKIKEKELDEAVKNCFVHLDAEQQKMHQDYLKVAANSTRFYPIKDAIDRLQKPKKDDLLDKSAIFSMQECIDKTQSIAQKLQKIFYHYHYSSSEFARAYDDVAVTFARKDKIEELQQELKEAMSQCVDSQKDTIGRKELLTSLYHLDKLVGYRKLPWYYSRIEDATYNLLNESTK